MENSNKLNLPFGEAFKKAWENYMEFYDKHGLKHSYEADNKVLRMIEERFDDENEAVEWVNGYEDIILRYFPHLLDADK